jgi:hypothetical protein
VPVPQRVDHASGRPFVLVGLSILPGGGWRCGIAGDGLLSMIHYLCTEYFQSGGKHQGCSSLTRGGMIAQMQYSLEVPDACP